ncbi:MAG: DUF1993 domain-containing protein [Pseudomonadota bacterium]
MQLTSLIVPGYSQMLGALSGWLEKAEVDVTDSEALLSARLAPDMFPLSTQVRFACVQAYEVVHRLRGDPLSEIWHELIAEGRNGGEAPGTMAEARARLKDAQDFLGGLSQDALDAGASREIAHELPTGMIFDMTGDQYARDWALPQFYFHVLTAYMILRHQGVPLGKADYVQHAFAYLRPGTMPAG